MSKVRREYKNAQDWWDNYVIKNDESHTKWGFSLSQTSAFNVKAWDKYRKGAGKFWDNHPEFRKQVYERYVNQYDKGLKKVIDNKPQLVIDNQMYYATQPKLSWDDFNQPFDDIMHTYDQTGKKPDLLHRKVEWDIHSHFAKEYKNRAIQKKYELWLMGEQPKQPNKVGTVFCPSEYEYVPGYYKRMESISEDFVEKNLANAI